MKKFRINGQDIGVIVESTSSPIGTINAFAGINLPIGWLLCNGESFDENTYKALYRVLGTNILPYRENFTNLGYDIIRATNHQSLAVSAIDDSIITDTNVWSSKALSEKIYPIGSIFINTTDINPRNILGFGEWEELGSNVIYNYYTADTSDYRAVLWKRLL